MSFSKIYGFTYFLGSVAMSSIPTELDRICKLVKRFASYLEEATTSLVLLGGVFQSIINHVKMIKSIRHVRQGGARRFR